MNTKNKKIRPELTSAGIEASYPVTVFDEFGKTRETHITGERPLTLYIDKREIVTLMTLGKNPELLVIGYLYNQRFIKKAEDLKSVQVDWDVESAVVVTRGGISNLEKRWLDTFLTENHGKRPLHKNEHVHYIENKSQRSQGLPTCFLIMLNNF